jgi:hypothetical protein
VHDARLASCTKLLAASDAVDHACLVVLCNILQQQSTQQRMPSTLPLITTSSPPRCPVILVPSAATSLINLMNAKEFLEDGVFVSSTEKRACVHTSANMSASLSGACVRCMPLCKMRLYLYCITRRSCVLLAAVCILTYSPQCGREEARSSDDHAPRPNLQSGRLG